MPCGTDREIAAGEYGEAPAGSDHLILGHESLGRVLARCPESESLAVGDLVVATVRCPCREHCAPCRTGFPDFCATGNYRERGIRGLHGFCRERFVARPEHLVRVPARLRGTGVLERQFPGLPASFITSNVPLADSPVVLAAQAPGALKTVIRFGS